MQCNTRGYVTQDEADHLPKTVNIVHNRVHVGRGVSVSRPMIVVENVDSMSPISSSPRALSRVKPAVSKNFSRVKCSASISEFRGGRYNTEGLIRAGSYEFRGTIAKQIRQLIKFEHAINKHVKN